MSDFEEGEKDNALPPVKQAKRWEIELTAATKELRRFHERSKKIVKIYLDDRDGATASGVAKINLFWANTQVLKAALYAKPPKVDVSNTNKDSNDDVSRVAGNVLERMLNHPMEVDDSDFDVAARQSISDYLIVGMGQIWYRYEAETEERETEAVIDPVTGAEIVPAQKYEVVVSEAALTDYVYWEDFFWSPARTWEEVRWVARRVFMGRDQLVARFGEKIGKLVPISKNKKNSDGNGPTNDPWEKAQIFEIWDKTTKQVYWHAKGYDVILDQKEDPLQVVGFFPCPPPLASNVTTSNFMPQADYIMSQDQYMQIDKLTTRLFHLTDACKVVGAYDKSSTALGRIFQEGMENQMIPVDNWAGFSEKGGIRGTMDFVPVDQIASVMVQVAQQRDAASAKLYEVQGIGDIMRGMTDPDETLGAQQLKAQFGGSRLQHKQMEIGAWVAAGQRIRANIICKHFQPQTIVEQSNIMNSPDAALANKAIEFLKAGDSKRYRITIESETMAMVDWAQERDARTQFLTAVGAFVQSVTPLIQAAPAAAPMVLEMAKWGLGGFRVSKEIETVLDQAIQAAQNPPAPAQPSPMEQAQLAKVGSEVEKNKASAFNDMANAKRNAGQAAENMAKAKGKHIENQAAEQVVGMLPAEQAGIGMVPLEPTPIPGF
jgi:hypothetical protein